MTSNDDCMLYVNTAMSEARVAELLRAETAGVLDRGDVTCDWAFFYVMRNDNRSSWKARRLDGFLYYKFIVEVTPAAGVDRARYVESLRRLIGRFRNAQARVVAACDFEEELGQAAGSWS